MSEPDQTGPVVQVDRRDDGVAVVTFSNGKVNALSGNLLEKIAAAADDLVANPPRAVVVTGGDRMFAAGADIGEFDGPDEALAVTNRFHTTLDKLAAIPRVTIAAVAGVALGGGCEMALACDLRVVHAKARFGQPEVLLGIIPGGGATQRLPRLVGAGRAKELMFSGRQVDATEALAIGLADRVVDGDVVAEAVGWASEFAAGPAVAQAYMKQAVDQGLDGALSDGLRLERNLFTEVFETEDSQTGVASFREHGPGKATFKGA